MARAIFFVILMLSHKLNGKFLNIFQSTEENCTNFSDDFAMVYHSHFVLVSSLNITLLQSGNHELEIDRFTQKTIKQINSFGSFLTITINERFLDNENYQKNYHYCLHYNIYDDNSTRSDSIKLDEDEFFKIKMLTSDTVEGHVIIAWNISVLEEFLNEDYRVVIPKSRAPYSLLFVSTQSECETLSFEFHRILKRFWVDYNVLNVIAQMPCSCDRKVFVYHPFVKNFDSWGVTKSHSIKKIAQNSGLITNSLKDFHQYPLKISLFERDPTAIKSLPKPLRLNPIYRALRIAFGGIDGCLLNVLAKNLNFKIMLMEKSDQENFGKVLPNGTSTGSLGDVINRRVDYSVNGRFLAGYGTDKIEFTVPYGSDKICVVVPKSPKVHKWKTLFNCFDSRSWILLLIVNLVSVIFWFLLRYMGDGSKAYWEMFSFAVGNPIIVKASLSQVFFLFSYMVFNVTIMGIIGGRLFTDFTTTTYYPEIDTLEDLDKSGFHIATNFWFLDYDKSDLAKSLKTKQIKVDHDVFDFIVNQSNTAVFGRQLDAKLCIKTKYLDENGRPLLHIADQCLYSFLIVNIVPKNSPFLKIFNHVITKLFEGGLTIKWYKDVDYARFIENVQSLRRNRKIRSFSLYDMQAAFYILLFGSFCSTMAFLVEITAGRKINKNKCST